MDKLNILDAMQTELAMQSRALIAIKMQRDIDRNRRLMLLRRMKKEHMFRQRTELKLKIAITASLLLSIMSMLIKL